MPIFLLLGVALLGAPGAQDSSLPYQVPDGWDRSQDPSTGLISISPRGLPFGRVCVITVFNPEAASSTAEAFHDEILKRAASNARVLEAPQRGSVGGFAVSAIHQLLPNGIQMWFRIYTARWSDRGQAFILAANAPDVAKRFAPVADAMMSRIAVPQLTVAPSAPTSPVQPPTSPSRRSPRPRAGAGAAASTAGSLNGLYAGLKIKGGFNYGVSKDYMVFFPNGRVFWRLPDEGLLDFDVARSEREMPEFWGHYQMKGDNFHIQWAGGLEYNGRRKSDGNLDISGTNYVSCTSGIDDQTLSGTYRPEYSGADPSHDVTFYPDGRFDDRGVRVVVGQLDLMYGRPKVPTHAGSGRYRIARNSIVFEYTDGRREQLSFYIPDDDGSSTPPLIVIHTYSVVRVPN